MPYVTFNAAGFTRCPKCHGGQRKQRGDYHIGCPGCAYAEEISANNASADVLERLFVIDLKGAA